MANSSYGAKIALISGLAVRTAAAWVWTSAAVDSLTVPNVATFLRPGLRGEHLLEHLVAAVERREAGDVDVGDVTLAARVGHELVQGQLGELGVRLLDLAGPWGCWRWRRRRRPGCSRRAPSRCPA